MKWVWTLLCNRAIIYSETRNSRSKDRGDPHGQHSWAGTNIPKSKLEPGQSHSPSWLRSQVSDSELSEGLAGIPALWQQLFSPKKAQVFNISSLEFCIHSSHMVAQIHIKLQVKLHFFASFSCSFFFCLKKVKWLCGLKSYSRLCAICWNQIPFTQSWMFPWQKPELDKFRKAS